MTPDQLAKSGSEHGEQVALFAFLAMAHNKGFEYAWEWADSGQLPIMAQLRVERCDALEWIHAIPNGGSRGDDEKSRMIRGGQMKAEGSRAGVADIFLPWPVGNWHGLYIEMKKPALKPKKEGGKGGLSEDQIEFASYAKRNGYGWIVCYTWREAASAIQQYIEWKG